MAAGLYNQEKQDASRIRKEDMDYFMIILPVKLGLILYVGYQFLH